MTLKLRWIAVAILAVSIALLLAPLQAVENNAATGLDKVVHFLLFGLVLWSFGVLFRRLPRTLAAGLAVASGGAIELLQALVGRDPSWGDFAADAAGVLAALFLWAAWRGFRPRQAFQ